MNEIIVIGGGLAGSEAALQIAKRKIKVKLYEMKPNKFSGAHSNKNLGEIVCSNSFKSNLVTNACGLLKEELRLLGSFLIPIADRVAVPAGQALAVDRERFAEEVTKEVENNEYIEIVREEVKKIPKGKVSTYKIIAIKIGNPKASRAVGNALHKNPNHKMIPCHRVVNRKGECSGSYAFGGKDVQERLLKKEGIKLKNNRVIGKYLK